MKTSYVEYAVEQTQKLLAIPSPSGCTQEAEKYVIDTLSQMGYTPYQMHKGGVGCTLGGEGKPLALAAHIDTLGLVVTQIKESGALRFSRIGGPSMCALETEGVRVRTRDGQIYRGTVQMDNPSVHVNAELQTQKRDEEHLEIRLDELVESAQDVKKLGILTGDVVFIDPRTEVTATGFIKSRFLDDKLSAGMLLALAKAVADGEVQLARKVTIFFSVYEEVGHGASAGLPADTEDLLVVDMGCVGAHLSCKETQVSICAKDSTGPYTDAMVTEVVRAARSGGVDFAVDVYPFYGSDARTALSSGMDIRTALIGAGVFASHGYERTHKKAVENTLSLLGVFVSALF